MSIKQVIVIRREFKDHCGNAMRMRRGKEIAQACHASTKWLLELYESSGTMSLDQFAWQFSGQTKICVQVSSEQELVALHEAALAAGLTSHLITDSGHTEFNGVPTKTCLAIGPNDSEKINLITGHLQLY